MYIGYRRRKFGEAILLNKWYVGIEIAARPAWMIGGFCPFIFLTCVKVTDFGTEQQVYNGTKMQKVGGWWQWCSPIVIELSIRRR